MSVHKGKVLRELYVASGLKMERFSKAVDYADKTIYYHFKQQDLNTSILERYEKGLKELGVKVDIWHVISLKRQGRDISGLVHERSAELMEEPESTYVRDQQHAADLLRQAADLLAKPPVTAPGRDKEGSK